MKISPDIKILLLGANVWYFGEGMLGPLFAVYAERIGGDVLDITWAWATFLIMTGLIYILVGKLIKGEKSQAKAMVIGYALNALFTFGYLFVSSPWHLLIVQAGLGIAEAMGTPTWDALFATHTENKEDTFAWGLASGQAQIITGIAIIAGGLIVSYFSFKALFITMGCVQVFATIIQARILIKNQ
ncbi:MAG TPA: MFS transporter [Chitinophagaceae bacterium]|nr:MFS transporter [Chitinophagaceae bacterium]